MKNIILLISTIFTLTSIFGQTTYSNSLTDKHVNIAGTKISLIPPDGFTKANNFLGFQQNQSGSTIMLLDIPGPFSETSKAMNKESLLSQGIEVKLIENITINNLPAIMITGEQNSRGNIYTKHILCFGNENETIIINGASPNNLGEVSRIVKNSMITCVYEPNKIINPFDIVDYSINLSGSNLKFAKFASNSLIFTKDGIIPTEIIDKTSLIIAKSFSKTEIKDEKLFCLNRLKQMPIEIIKTKTINKITIDKISGYEIIATGQDKKTMEKEEVYQVILFSDDLYYLFLGSTKLEIEKNINDIKETIMTFKRK
jgi:hypothetical protein